MVKSTFVAFVERSAESSRIGTIELSGGKVKRYAETETEGGIFEIARTPHRQRIAYRVEERLRLLDLASGSTVELHHPVLAGNPRRSAYRPDGKRLVVLDAHRAIALGGTEPRITNFTMDEEPVDVLWFRNGSGFLILLRNTEKGAKTAMRLYGVSDGDGAVSPGIHVASERLLGWHDSRLMAFGPDASGIQAAGFLTMTGEFVPRRSTSPDEEPEIYQHYLGLSDRLVVSNITEHTSDHLSLSITSRGCVGKRPWLEGFRRPEALSFSPDEQMAVFVDRSRAEVLDSPYGGDLQLTNVDSSDGTASTRLLLKASESGFYSRAVVWNEGDGA